MFRACAHLPTKALLGLPVCLTRNMSFMLSGTLNLFANLFVLKAFLNSLNYLFQSETRKLLFSRKLANYLPSKDLREMKRSSIVTDEKLSVEEGTSISTVMTLPELTSTLKIGRTQPDVTSPA